MSKKKHLIYTVYRMHDLCMIPWLKTRKYQSAILEMDRMNVEMEMRGEKDRFVLEWAYE